MPGAVAAYPEAMTRVRAATGALTAATLVVVAAGAVAATRTTGSVAFWFAGSAAVAGINLALAVVVAWWAPRNACAVVLALAGLCVATPAAVDSWQLAAVGTGLPLSPYVVALSQGVWMLYYLPLAWLLLIFPTGRLLSPRWRLVLVGLPAAVLVHTVATAVSPAPYAEPFADAAKVLGSSPAAQYVSVGVLPIFLGLLVASGVSIFRRYRARPAERGQLRWMVAAGATVPLTLLLCWLSYLVLGTVDLVVLGLAAMYVAVPAATAIALVRSTLFDVDALLVRTTVYAGFGAVLLAALGLVAALAGWAAGRTSVALAVIVTVVVLIGLMPLRRRAIRQVAAWLFPRRERTLRRLESLQRDVHAGVRPPEALEQTLQEAIGDPELRVGYRLPGGCRWLDPQGGVLQPGPAAIDIEMAGDLVATVIPRRPLLGWSVEIATVVGFLSELVRLRLETAAALQQAEASRRRLLAAHEDERQRLERDLHDGAQQRLVALGMSLRRTQRQLSGADPELFDLLDNSVRELQTAVAELRQIAHGLRPSSLDDGLSAALNSLRRRVTVPLQIEVGTGELPEPISTTAYFVASEAVTNAIRYASANTIALTVTPSPRGVVVRVRDDGRGGAVLRTGSGLAGLRDRVRALGGELSVVSPAERGTVVEAVLPCGS